MSKNISLLNWRCSLSWRRFLCWRRFAIWRRPFSFYLLAIAALLSTAVLLDKSYPLAAPYAQHPAQVVLAANGEPLRSFGDSDGIHQYRITNHQVSPFYLQALFNYEDKWFYLHPGINPFAVARAGWQWLKEGEIISGGSTLTMQVARLLHPHAKTVWGKLTQSFRALQLEAHYSKDKILNLYLNLAPFGGNLAGVEAASRFYFNKPASELNHAEAALLVALPQRPSAWRPDRHPKAAIKARNKVLKRLYGSALISEKELTELCKQPIQSIRYASPLHAPLLSQHLITQHPTKAKVQSSIDMSLQHKVERLMAQLKYQLPAKTSAAVLIAENRRHQILAYKGSVDFNDNSRFAHVDMTQALRSPGSTLKPFIYGLALDQGLIHSQSLLSDIPTSFDGYKPLNFDQKFRGAISAAHALQLSLNVPLIQLLNRLKADYFDQRLQQSGIHLVHHKANLAIGLGGTGSRLLDLVTLYSGLANEGQVTPLKLTIDNASLTSHKLMSPAASWIVWKMLSDIPAPDRVTRTSRRTLGWKSGTSYGFRDTWAIGVSPDYTVGVWLGRPDGSPIVGHMGAKNAGPVLFDLFDLLPPDQLKLKQPDGVKLTEICWPGGMAKRLTPEAKCQIEKSAYTIRGRTPATLESSGTYVQHHQWPIKLRDWLKVTDNQRGAVKITSLRSGQHYFSEQLDQLPLIANESSTKVNWYVNGKLYKESHLRLSNYQGRVKVSACNLFGCDSQTIEVH